MYMGCAHIALHSKSQALHMSAFPVLLLQVWAVELLCWVLNAGPHACAASTLLTESFPQPLACLYFTNTHCNPPN